MDLSIFEAFSFAIISGIWQIGKCQHGSVVGNQFVKYGDLDVIVDEENKVYLVEKDGEYGVLDKHGKVIIHAENDKIGQIVDFVAGRNRYVGYLISLASHSYKKFKIGLDCANGASWMIAKSVFDALGAQTVVIGAKPNGLNINKNCGSTHIESLVNEVKEKHLDFGFAFDGDCDRCIAVDENGNVAWSNPIFLK